MTCGDSVSAWMNPGFGSTWSGTTSHGSDTIVAVFVPLLNVSATVFITGVPGVGSWSFGQNLKWTAAIGGFEWHFEVHAVDCDTSGNVISAHGSATDVNSNVYTVDITRVI